MKKTYFLLICFILMSWQATLGHSLLRPAVDDTGVSELFHLDKIEIPPLNGVNHLDNINLIPAVDAVNVPGVNDKTRATDQPNFRRLTGDQVLYSCSATNNTYNLNYFKLVLTAGQSNVPVEYYTTQALANAGGTGNITSSTGYNPGSLTEIWARVRVSTGPDVYDVIKITLANVNTSTLTAALEVVASQSVCYNTAASFNVVGTPGATVTYNFSTDPNEVFSLVLDANGLGTITTPTLRSAISVDIRCITLNNQTRFLNTASCNAGVVKRINVRGEMDVLMTYENPERTDICADGNVIQVRLTAVNASAAPYVFTYSFAGVIHEVTSLQPFIILDLSVQTAGDFQLRFLELKTGAGVNLCSKEFTNKTLNITSLSNSRGCTEMTAFCATNDPTIRFDNVFGVDDMGRLWCLMQTPNPFWYYMQVGQTGTLNIDMKQYDRNGTQMDIDYVAYGPFNASLNPNLLRNELSNLCCQISHINALGQTTNWAANPMVIGCSYSGSFNERFTANGTEGDIFVFLMNNFGRRDGEVVLSLLPSSTGATSCEAVCPLFLPELVDLCEGQEIIFESNILDAQTYVWKRDGVVIGGNFPTLTVTESGVYELTVSKSGCPVKTAVSIVTVHAEFAAAQPRVVEQCIVERLDIAPIATALVANPNDYYFTYYESREDAFAGVNPVNPSNYLPRIIDPQFNLPAGTNEGFTKYVVYVAIKSQFNTCPVVREIQIITGYCENPIFVCEETLNSETGIFDLTELRAQFFVNDPLTSTVTFYRSAEDAADSLNPIVDYTAITAQNLAEIFIVRTFTDVDVLPVTTSVVLQTITLPNATITTDDLVLCPGADAVFTIEGKPDAKVTYTYNGTPYEVTLNATGTAVVTLTGLTANTVVSLNEISSETTIPGIEDPIECVNLLTDILNITFIEKSVATVVAPTEVCQNTNNVVFNITGSVGVAPYHITYNINGGTPVDVVTTGNTIAIPVDTSVVGNQVITITSIASATSTTCVSTAVVTATVQVNELPSADLTLDAEVCTNGTVTAQFTGTPNATITFDLNGTVQTATLNAAGTYSLVLNNLITDTTINLTKVVENPTLCEQLLTVTKTVRVIVLPTATIATTDATLCSGASTTVTIRGNANATVTYTVNGTTQTVVLNNSGEAVIATGALTVNTVYQLVSIQGACDNVLTGQTQITVLPLPTATISGTNQVCLNAAQPQITFIGANSVAPYTFAYTINGGALQQVVSTTATVTVDVPTTTAGSFVYELVSVTSGNGCTQTQAGTATITVLSLPTVAITATANVCQGQTGRVEFVGTPNANVTFTDGVTVQNITLLAYGTFGMDVVVNANMTFTLQSVTDVAGCTAAVTTSATITKLDLPTVTISGNQSICSGTSAQFVLTGTAGATVTYTANGVTQTAVLDADGTKTIATGNLTVNTVYELVSIAGVCQNTAAGAITVQIIELPTATVANSGNICLNGAGAQVTFTGANGQAPYTFVYTVNGGTPQTVVSTTNTVSVPVGTTVAGTYVYALVSVSSASSPVCQQAQTGQTSIEVYALPTATISATANVCEGQNGVVTFTGTPNAVVTFTDGTTVQNITLLADGTYNMNVLVNATVTFTLQSVADARGCTSVLNTSATITKIDLPTVAISGNQSICSGTSAQFVLTGTAGATVTYTANGVTQTAVLEADGTKTIATGNLTVDTVYELVSIAGVCQNTAAGSITVQIIELPTATVANSGNICLNGAGAQVTFTGANGQAPYTFVYTINGGTPQTVVSTTDSVTVPVNTSVAGTYVYALVSVSSATSPVCQQAQTAQTSIEVYALPTATISATANVCEGQNGVVAFTGTPNAVVTFTDGTTVQNITLLADGTYQMNVLVNANMTFTLQSITDANGCTAALNTNATITKVDLPTASITGSQSICYGTAAQFVLNGTPGATVTYTLNGQTQTAVLANNGTLTVATANLTSDAVISLVSVSGTCQNTATGTITIQVVALPTATISGNTTICNAERSVILFNGTPGATVSYTVNNGGVETVTLGADGTFSLNTPRLFDTTVYQLVGIVANDATGCVNTLNETATVTVTPIPDVDRFVVGNTVVCSGDAVGIQLFGNTADVNFSWTVAQNGVTGASAGTGNVISQQVFAANASGTVIYTVTPTIGNCVGQPVEITVTVTPIPVMTTSTENFGICTGGTALIQIGSNVAGATYNWNSTATNGITGASGGTGTEINQVLVNNSTQVGEVTYTITPFYGNCQGETKSVVVTVYPTPVVVATPAEEFLCSGNTTNISISANVPGTTFTWTAVGTGVSGALPGSGNTIAQTLTAVGAAGTVEYIITPTVNGCVGAPTSVLVTVTPTPEIFANSNPPAICSESFTGISLSASIPGTTFEWTVVQNGVEGAFADAGSVIDQQLFTTRNAQGTVVYTVTPYANGCAGNSVTITIRVNPLPMSNVVGGYVCIDPIRNEVISTHEMVSGLDTANHTFVWMLDGEIIPGAVGPNYTATEAGEYTLISTNVNTLCSATQRVVVTESNPAQSATYVLTDYFNDAQTLTITVDGNGEYLYQLDDYAVQDSNVFHNVLPGVHQVIITDKQGCTYLVLTDIVTMQFPNFFTPNQDGVNDTWNIPSLSNQRNAIIYIYDRFGKLMKQISPQGSGWDGTHAGVPVPATDYWFVVEFDEAGSRRTFRSHFSLKR